MVEPALRNDNELEASVEIFGMVDELCRSALAVISALHEYTDYSSEFATVSKMLCATFFCTNTELDVLKGVLDRFRNSKQLLDQSGQADWECPLQTDYVLA